MWLLLAAFLAAPAAQGDSPPALARILSRVSEEAEVLAQNITKTLTQETLEQRAVMAPSRFRPRIGNNATELVKPRFRLRHIVSEYSVGTFKESQSHDLHEFREVTAVDGHQVQSPENARHALSLGMRAQDDRLRKRMLDDFARYGLVDVAVDYGLILLMFSPRGIENLQISLGEQANIGADAAVALRWKQKSEVGGEIEFSGRRIIRQALEGVLWVRTDGLPLRIEAWAEYAESQHKVRDEATVDYALSAHGFLTPASVVHRHLVDGQLFTENLYRYEPFKMFSSDAEIKFTEVPEMPPAAPPAIKK